MAHTIVMTGATRGIGRAAVEHIAALDAEAHLVLLARGNAGPELATHLNANGGTASSIPTDLLSLTSVRAAVEKIEQGLERGSLPPLRGFVGNAGLQFTNDVTESLDGFEVTFAINVLANHVLIRQLQDRFVQGSRITITVSDTHFGDFRHNFGMVPGPSWHDPLSLAKVGAFSNPETTTAGRTAYSTSKLAAIYLIHEFARRLPAGIDIVGFNPGFVPGTDLARDADAISRFVMRRMMPFLTWTPMATNKEAAGRYLADAALGRIQVATGSYVNRATEERSSEESYDPDREHRTWEIVEELTRPFQRKWSVS